MNCRQKNHNVMCSWHLPFPHRNTFKVSPSAKHGPCNIRDENRTLGNTKGRKVTSLETAIRRCNYRGVDKSLARPGRKQARKHVRDASDFNNIETRAVIKFFFFPARQGAEGNSRHSDRNISFFPSWSG